MAVRRVRTRFTSRCMGLVIFPLLLLQLTGCAITPKKASTQFSSFAQVTASLAQDVQKVYFLTIPAAQQHITYRIITQLDKEDAKLRIMNDAYGLKQKDPYLEQYASIVASHVAYLQFLITYSTSLKNIMTSTSIAELQTNIQTFGTTLDSLKTNALTQQAFAGTNVSFAAIAKVAAGAAGTFLEIKRNAAVKSIVTQASPAIHDVLGRMTEEIGACATATTMGHGFIALAMSSYYRSLLDSQQDAFNSMKKANTEQRTKRFDKLQEVLQQRQKYDMTCTILQQTNATLTAYAALHEKLLLAFNKNSSDLSDALANIALQIQTIEAALGNLSTKEKS